jgi:hypothetical protein
MLAKAIEAAKRVGLIDAPRTSFSLLCSTAVLPLT